MQGVLATREVAMILRFLLAEACGAIWGYQRERAEELVGLRTHILVAVGATLSTVVSV